ncbi:MAG: NUDIX hydrolase [Pyrinomonadaceae bacterium]|nr:NUDIX hydrolase [Pyrinomonadaceae bacterium]
MSKPQTLASSVVYEGRIFDLRVDDIREADIEYKREIVVHKGSAVIVPVFDDMTVGLVRQYRHAAGRYLLEIPAGTLEKDEDPRVGAIRELEEEIGVVAASVELLTEFYVSPGFLTEKMFVYLATGLTETAQNLDGDEIIEIERIPLAHTIAMTRDGRIEDAKTIVGLLITGSKFGFSP